MRLSKAEFEACKVMVLSGGALKGLSYCGFFAALRQFGIDIGARAGCPSLQRISGCSIGALVGLFLVLGYSGAELLDVVHSASIGDLFQPDLLLVMEPGRVSVDTGNLMQEFIVGALCKKLNVGATEARGVTLAQLKQRKGLELETWATDVQHGRLQEFNAVSTPHVPVLSAVFASLALPPLLPPLAINDVLYADGGVMNHFPLRLATGDVQAHEVIALSLKNSDPFSTKNILSYMKHIVKLTQKLGDEAEAAATPPALLERVIHLKVPDFNILEATLLAAEFGSYKHKMLEGGRACALTFFA